MSHDPEAAEAIDQWLAMPQRPDRDTATDLLDYLTAAGYTVTKDRYEPAGLEWLKTSKPDGTSYCNHGSWDYCTAKHDTVQPLYRKIEGSTDG